MNAQEAIEIVEKEYLVDLDVIKELVEEGLMDEKMSDEINRVHEALGIVLASAKVLHKEKNKIIEELEFNMIWTEQETQHGN